MGEPKWCTGVVGLDPGGGSLAARRASSGKCDGPEDAQRRIGEGTCRSCRKGTAAASVASWDEGCVVGRSLYDRVLVIICGWRNNCRAKCRRGRTSWPAAIGRCAPT